MAEQTIHHGRNIKRFREMLLMKQEALCIELGDDWTQKKVSQLENKEIIDQNILEQVAKVLHISPEAIQNFDGETAMNFISNTFNAFNDHSNGYNYYPVFNFNPMEKLMESIEDNRALYERLLESEKDKVALLQQLIDKLSN